MGRCRCLGGKGFKTNTKAYAASAYAPKLSSFADLVAITLLQQRIYENCYTTRHAPEVLQPTSKPSRPQVL